MDNIITAEKALSIRKNHDGVSGASLERTVNLIADHIQVAAECGATHTQFRLPYHFTEGARQEIMGILFNKGYNVKFEQSGGDNLAGLYFRPRTYLTIAWG